MKLSQLFPSNYLHASDLDEKGGDVVATIVGIKMERVGRDQEIKPLVFFKEFEKAMILNKTNAYSIGMLHGHDSDKWSAKQITLYPSTVFVQGESKECIRVRETVPARAGNGSPKAPTGEMLDDEIPF